MKILVIVSSLSTGGAQRVASNLIMGFPDGCDIDILLNDTDEITFPYKGQIIDLGLKPEKDKGKLSYQLKVFFKRLTVLNRIKKENKYDAAISFLDSANIANIVTGNKFCKTIATVHSKLSASSFDWRYKYIVFPLIRLLYKHADYVVAVSLGIEDDLRNKIKYNNENLVTIYNGFDFDTIREKAKEKIPENHLNIFKDYKTIIAVGRLCKAKAYWHLIRAMRIVVDELCDVRLVIAGEGEQRDYLSNLIKKLDLDSNVILLGFVENPYKYIDKAEVFVMSSIYEGLPSAMIEALALGKPCVATDFKSGAREILAPEMDLKEELKNEILKADFGIICPVCDGIEYDDAAPYTNEELLLAEGIKQMCSDQGIREKYSQKMKEAISKFDIDNMVQNYIDLIMQNET